MKTYTAILILLLMLFGISACSEEPREFTTHEPGKYKGAIDPLLAKGSIDLNNRFMQVQTDR